MNNRKFDPKGMILILAFLLPLAGGFTSIASGAPMTPEYAARKENHRKQQEQRITQEQRKAAADNLKAERLKVYKARQAVKQSPPTLTIDNK